MQTKQKHCWIPAALLIVMLLVTAGDAWAITRRHDRADSNYTNLANNVHAYGGLVSGSGWIGSGTLISPSWVLTAGHVVTGGPMSFVTSAGSITVDQQEPYGASDIGLAHLSSPITTIAPVKLYDLSYGTELGQECIILGAGHTGTGLTGQTGGGGTRRAAQTYVHANNWYGDSLITWFRSPTGGAANLEGGSAQGDSGGGLLLEADGEWTIAGVMSQVWSGGTGGDTYGKYNTGGVYVPSAPLNDWIRSFATDAMVIPEPLTLTLLGLAGLVMLLKRRR